MDKRNNPNPLPFDEAKDLWDSLGKNGADEIEPLTEEEALEFRRKLYARIDAYEAKKRKRNTIRYTSLMVAATLILISSILAYRLFYLPDIYQANRNALTVSLKDGSIVTLYKGAKLTVQKSFPSETRDVSLDGEARFSVTKSKEHPFIVHGNGYEVKVHGTIFKVLQEKDNFRVDLYEGSVSVMQPGQKAVSRIKPGQTFNNYGQKTIAVVLPTERNPLNNKSDKKIDPIPEIVLRDCSIRNAIPIIEEITGKNIQIPKELENTPVSVQLKNVDSDKMLNDLADYLNLKITKTKQGYEFTE